MACFLYYGPPVLCESRRRLPEHGLQAFTDLGDSVTMTSGIFFYDAEINQRGDFYPGEADDPRFLNADPLSQAAVGAGTMVNFYAQRDLSAPDAR